MNKRAAQDISERVGPKAPFVEDAFADGICKDCLDRVLTFGDATAHAADDDNAELGGLSEDVIEKQSDGAVGLFNMLATDNVAILADEVGTGKTYQALGVISMVFARKPDARVVVIAPNASVQSGWRSKYTDFVNKKLKGTWLRDPLTGMSTHPLYDCDNVRDFAKEYRDNPRGLFLTRVSSFSNLRGSLDSGDTGELCALDHKAKTKPSPSDIRDHWRRKGIFIGEEVLDDVDDEPLTTSLAINIEAARQFATVLDTFDLVVVDESHNLRNRGGNIKTHVVSRLFKFRIPGEDDAKDEPLRPRLLMLTATPAQNSEQDIYHQLSYRDSRAEQHLRSNDDKGKNDYLKSRMVRRLRKLSDKTKYDYRLELPRRTLDGDGVDLLDDNQENNERLTQELMLALVQKGLAHLRQARGDGTTELKKSVKMGYLETFESYEDPQDARVEPDDGSSHDDVDNDTEADDADLLEHIVQAFRNDDRTPNRLPPHPKLSFLEDEYEAMLRGERSDKPDKMLIFVRRRASVREIANRMCQTYDRVALEELREVYGLPTEVREPDDFIRFVHETLTGKKDEQLIELSLQKDDDAVAFSKLLAPFKTGSETSRGGFGFRNRFTSSNPLGDFFSENRLRLLFDISKCEGATDFNDFDGFLRAVLPGRLGHRLEELVDGEGGPTNKQQKRQYVDIAVLTAALRRPPAEGLHTEVATTLRKELESRLANNKDFGRFLAQWKRTLDNSDNGDDSAPLNLSLLRQEHFWDEMRQWALDAHDALDDDRRRIAQMLVPDCKPERWQTTLRRRAGWQAMVSKQLRMSGAILDLFFAYRAVAPDSSSESYQQPMIDAFCDTLLDKAGSEHRRFQNLRHRIAQTADLFDHLVKHLQIDESKWSTHNWNKLNNQEPAVGVMGGTGGRESVIAKFNAPFFPDVVVSTSVLREGVDLHLSCRRVWHYGLPASPGILEQQTGRVDRYFARVHRALQRQRDQWEDQWEARRPNREVSPANANDELEATLDVGYPYVPRSVDEMQVKRLLVRKRTIEPLLDRGTAAPQTSDEISLDDWMTSPPEEIVAPKDSDSAGTDTPFPADTSAADSHACRPAENPTSPRMRQAFGRLIEAFIASLSDDSCPFQLPLYTDCSKPSPKELLNAAALGSPLALVNTFVSRAAGPDNTTRLMLRSEPDDKSHAHRHQPTLIFLRFVPHAGLHMMEFVTPLEATAEQTKMLKSKILTDEEYRLSGCVIANSSTRRGLQHWSTHLVSSFAVRLEAALDEKTRCALVEHLVEHLESFVKTADRLELEVLSNDITEKRVRDALQNDETSEKP